MELRNTAVPIKYCVLQTNDAKNSNLNDYVYPLIYVPEDPYPIKGFRIDEFGVIYMYTLTQDLRVNKYEPKTWSENIFDAEGWDVINYLESWDEN